MSAEVCTCCSCKIHSRGEFHTGELVGPRDHLRRPADPPALVKAATALAKAVEAEVVARGLWEAARGPATTLARSLGKEWEHRGGIKNAPTEARATLESLTRAEQRAWAALQKAGEATVKARQHHAAEQAKATQDAINNW